MIISEVINGINKNINILKMKLFSKEYLENKLNNDIMNFFYTKEEIEEFKNKYSV